MDIPVKRSHIHQSKENDLEPSARKLESRDHIPILLVVEFCKTENGKEREEEEHRVQEDKSRNAQPPDVWVPSDKL